MIIFDRESRSFSVINDQREFGFVDNMAKMSSSGSKPMITKPSIREYKKITRSIPHHPTQIQVNPLKRVNSSKDLERMMQISSENRRDKFKQKLNNIKK